MEWGPWGISCRVSPETEYLLEFCAPRTSSPCEVPTLTGERARRWPASLRAQLQQEAVGSDTHNPRGYGFLGQALGSMDLGEGSSSN